MVDVVDFAFTVAQIDQRLDDRQDVLTAQDANSVLGFEVETHVHLHAADRREIIALGIEEQALEHRIRRIQRRRFAGPHDPVDVHQRFFVVGVLVDVERVANERADRDMVDVEDREFLQLGVLEDRDQLCVELVAGLGENLPCLQVDDVLGEVSSGEILRRDQNVLEAGFTEFTCTACRDLLAALGYDFARLRIDEIRHRRHAAQLLWRKRNLPAALRTP